jgi:predicted glycoside hydrolase/deacetylase ChbG (UPF0249 family)
VDDLGIHPSINDGIFFAHRYGIVTAAPWALIYRSRHENP